MCHNYDPFHTDFHMCSWPEGLISSDDYISINNNNTILAQYFSSLSEQNVIYLANTSTSIVSSISTSTGAGTEEGGWRNPDYQNSGSGTMISFSHFLPRQE